MNMQSHPIRVLLISDDKDDCIVGLDLPGSTDFLAHQFVSPRFAITAHPGTLQKLGYFPTEPVIHCQKCFSHRHTRFEAHSCPLSKAGIEFCQRRQT